MGRYHKKTQDSSGVGEQLMSTYVLSSLQESLKLPLHLTWRNGPEMPFWMSHYVQSVVALGKLYVGGGLVGGSSKKNHTVMVYDISSAKWASLPPYKAYQFAMTVIDHNLVLVGGLERDGGDSKLLGVWIADRKVWTYPYPDMPTARQTPSAVVSNDWLVVAGGSSGSGRVLTCIEVLDINRKRWYAGPSTPTPWTSMKTAVVGDMAYFMGGQDSTSATNKVFQACIPALISHITSKAFQQTERQIWKEIPGLQLTWSTPLSMTGSLLAVGGKDEDDKAMTAIHHYQPDIGVWMKVEDLPSPCYGCTCAMITDKC